MAAKPQRDLGRYAMQLAMREALRSMTDDQAFAVYDALAQVAEQIEHDYIPTLDDVDEIARETAKLDAVRLVTDAAERELAQLARSKP